METPKTDKPTPIDTPSLEKQILEDKAEIEQEHEDEESAEAIETPDIPSSEMELMGEAAATDNDFLSEDESPEFVDSKQSPYAWQEGSLLSENFPLKSAIEAILFTTQKPMKPHEIQELLQDENLSTRDISLVLDQLSEFYTLHAGGFRLEYIKNQGYQFRSVPEAAPLIERMFAKRPRTLSRAALETLAIISYKQPLTRAEIEFIRGVDAASALKVLIDRGLVTSVGRKQDPGRPLLFGTTEEFLRVYGFRTLNDLPSLDSLQVNQEVMDAAEAKLRAFQQGDDPGIEEMISGDSAEEAGGVRDDHIAPDVESEVRESAHRAGASLAPEDDHEDWEIMASRSGDPLDDEGVIPDFPESDYENEEDEQ